MNRKHAPVVVTVFAIAALFAGNAHASAAKKLASITVSPVHLADGIVELTGEWNYQDTSSLAAIVGFGSRDIDAVPGSLLELGVQYRYYLMSRFDGLHARSWNSGRTR